ncbi:MAG: ATP-binding protein [Betaproteobacteria bacterium]
MRIQHTASPPPNKLGGVGAAVAGIAALSLLLLPLERFAGDIGINVDFAHAALIVLTVGIALTVKVTGWSVLDDRLRPAAQPLVLVFTGIGLLGVVYLLAVSFAPSFPAFGSAFGGVLGSGLGLTVASGLLATSLIPHGAERGRDQWTWVAALPGFAVAAVLALSFAFAITASSPHLLGAVLAGVTLVAYALAWLQLRVRGRHAQMDDRAYLVAAIVAGMLAELLQWLPGANPGLRLLLGDLYRVAAVVLVYVALFHWIARAPFIELQDAEAALRSEQQQLARMRQIAKLGSWEWNLATDAIWASSEVREMFNVPAQKTDLTRADFEDLIYREDVARLRSAACAAMEGLAPYSVDYRILGADGSAHTMHSEGHVEHDESGKPARMWGIVQDITERVAVEHALRQSAAQIRGMNVELEQRVTQRTRQLAASNRELEAFGYSVSHDLQAPLRRIERYADLLSAASAAQLDNGGRDMLQRIQDACAQTKQLITDLLKLSQITRTELSRSAVDLSALSARVLEQIERGANPPRRVETTIAPGIVLDGDADMLRILLDNLLGNAWKFTARTDKPRISVGPIGAAEGKGFYVSDNGAGFDMRHAHKLFGAFQRLHSQEDFKGTGIGLAIVQRIVNVHGWHIQASSEPGHGTTFTIKAN